MLNLVYSIIAVSMKKIIEIIIKVDDWLMAAGYGMYPQLTKHQTKNTK